MTKQQLFDAMSGRISMTAIQEYLSYDKGTGLIYWKLDRGKIKSGQLAGTKRADGYIKIKFFGYPYLAHRIAFLLVLGRFPKNECDHINGIRDDNRWVNLRDVDRQTNGKNARKPTNNTSGVVGVCWCKTTGKWRSNINILGIQKNLGKYLDFFDAVCARKSAEHRYGFHSNHAKPSKDCVNLVLNRRR